MISMIAAVDKKMGIGKNGKLLVRLNSDMEYFKKKTEGHVVIMGYNTYMSLPKRPLPNRINVVLTRKEIDIKGALVFNDINTLLEWIKYNFSKEEVFVCGGESIYRQMIKYADKIYLTHIFEEFDADAFFPTLGSEWKIENIECKRENIEHEYPHIFITYKKKKNY